MDKLAQEHHIYMTRNGRISMAGEEQPLPPFCTTATLPICAPPHVSYVPRYPSAICPTCTTHSSWVLNLHSI